MKSELNISLIQFSPEWEQIHTNVERLTGMLDKTPDSTDLVILPEMFSTGFSMSPEKLAEHLNGFTVKWMREMAISKKIAITGSLIIEEDGNYFNRLVFAMPDGTYKYYDKRHLFRYGGEHKVYTPGTHRLITEFKGWRICPMICYDLRFPLWSINRNDYDLLIYVANWPDVRMRAWKILPLARAIENQCFVAAVNRTGDDGTIAHSGASKVVNFKGEIISESLKAEEEIISASLDFDHLHKFRQKYDFSRDGEKFGIFY
ncbi:MAG: nitrilase family protein [Prevotellaceae bacterium]|jgi:predicted amidohydrolase|nr:nitrilase family protein [Prevotellaceae bacterium]